MTFHLKNIFFFLQVVIHDTDERTLGKECYALNDPHMRTFGERFVNKIA